MHQLFIRFTGMVCVLLVLSTSAKHLGKDEYSNDDELITGNDEETKPSLLFFEAWLKGAAFPPKKNCHDDSSEEGPLLEQLEADSVQPPVDGSNVSASKIPEVNVVIIEVQNTTDIVQIEGGLLVICIKSNDTECPEEIGEEIAEIA